MGGLPRPPGVGERTTSDARCPTRSSVCLAPAVGGGVLAAPCAGCRMTWVARANQPPRPYQWCAGCAREIGCVGRWTEAGAPWVTWVQAVTLNVRNQPTPAVTLPRGVEDAAPYGRQLNVGISIVVNRCVSAANFRPPLGSPERGAVAALCAVTEGLRPTLVRCGCPP